MNFVFHKKYDVAVVGAGVAGVAAAVAAARRGRRVALIEKQTLIGGLATSGLIFVYLPLCNGFSTQVTFGLAEELLRASSEFSPFELFEKWGGRSHRQHRPGGRFELEFSPAGFTLTLDDFLERAHVDLWLDSRVCAVQTRANRVTALEIENTSGRGILEADCFVDASGEALLIRRAGGEVITDVNFHTMWMMEMAPDAAHYHLSGSLHIQPFCFGEADFEPGAGCDGRRVTDFTRQAWRRLREHYRNCYEQGGCSAYTRFPVHLPAMAQFRKIAGIVGRTMLDSHGEQRRVEDSIGMVGDWRRSGPVWETPFGALVPEKIDGVFAAGRCIASARDAWEVYRVIPAAAMTGEAAGIAAALASEKGCAASAVRACDVQDALRAQGLKLHLDEVALAYEPIAPADGKTALRTE